MSRAAMGLCQCHVPRSCTASVGERRSRVSRPRAKAQDRDAVRVSRTCREVCSEHGHPVLFHWFPVCVPRCFDKRCHIFRDSDVNQTYLLGTHFFLVPLFYRRAVRHLKGACNKCWAVVVVGRASVCEQSLANAIVARNALCVAFGDDSVMYEHAVFGSFSWPPTSLNESPGGVVLHQLVSLCFRIYWVE